MESGIQNEKSKKPCSLQEIYDQTVLHLAKLAMSPSTIDQGRWRVRELMNDSSGLFGNIATDIKQKIEELKCVEQQELMQIKSK